MDNVEKMVTNENTKYPLPLIAVSVLGSPGLATKYKIQKNKNTKIQN